MLEDFVGRSPELEILNKAYAEKKSTFYPVYGRRRVGKTELILRFTEDKPADSVWVIYWLYGEGGPRE